MDVGRGVFFVRKYRAFKVDKEVRGSFSREIFGCVGFLGR